MINTLTTDLIDKNSFGEDLFYLLAVGKWRKDKNRITLI